MCDELSNEALYIIGAYWHLIINAPGRSQINVKQIHLARIARVCFEINKFFVFSDRFTSRQVWSVGRRYVTLYRVWSLLCLGWHQSPGSFPKCGLYLVSCKDICKNDLFDSYMSRSDWQIFPLFYDFIWNCVTNQFFELKNVSYPLNCDLK